MKYQKGDVICFSGNDFISLVVKIATLSNISHIGIMIDDENMIEAVSPVVRIIKLEDKIREYNGKIYYCRLNDKSREKLEKNIESFDACVKSIVGKKYDYKLFAQMGINIVIGNKYHYKEDTDELLCSEAGEYLLESADITCKRNNASKFTPKKIYNLKIYKEKPRIK